MLLLRKKEDFIGCLDFDQICKVVVKTVANTNFVYFCVRDTQKRFFKCMDLRSIDFMHTIPNLRFSALRGPALIILCVTDFFVL